MLIDAHLWKTRCIQSVNGFAMKSFIDLDGSDYIDMATEFNGVISQS